MPVDLRSSTKPLRALLFATAIYPLQVPIASAQPQTAPAEEFGRLEEITVTARKTEERLQSVPASVSVMSASDLADSGITAFEDVLAHVPNVSMGGGIAGALQGQLGIRGVSTLVRNIGVESGVGIYIDGVYLGRPESYNQELIDVAQIEILRGPQGTLFGKNTIAGVFNITTIRPEDEPAGAVKVEVGNYDLMRTQAYVTAPIVEGVLSGKLAGAYVLRDGVYRHLSGGDAGGEIDVASYRGALYYTPTAASEVILAVDGLQDRGSPAFFQVTDLAGVESPMETTPWRLNNNRPNSLQRDNHGASLTATVDVASGTLTSISALRRSEYEASLDDDQEQVDYLAVDEWGDVTRFFTQELRFNRRIGERFDYVAGLYYFDQKVTTDRVLALGADLGIPGEPALGTRGTVETSTYAAYGSLNYRFTPSTTLSLGLRYTREEKDADFVQDDTTGIFALLNLPSLTYRGSASDDDFSPTVSLSHQFTSDVMIYGRYARGFKSAAFNVDLVPSTSGLSAGPEYATTYELGMKSDLFDRRLRANFAVFETHYEDMQVSQLLGSGVTLNNAGEATIRGYEVELAGYVAQGLKLEGSLGYLDPTYDRYENCSIPAALGGGSIDCSGNRIIGAAKYTYQLAVQYDQPLAGGDFLARVDFSSQSPVHFEATNSQRFASDWRSVLNARVGLSSLGGRWDFFVWGRNLTDETYVTYRDDRSAIGVLQTTAYGEPRTYGVTLSVSF